MPWSRIARRARQLFFFLLPVLIFTAQVWAQKKGEATEEPKETYVLSYALLILCAALGLFPVCRPAGRDKRAKRRND